MNIDLLDYLKRGRDIRIKPSLAVKKKLQVYLRLKGIGIHYEYDYNIGLADHIRAAYFHHIFYKTV